jgi:hypothetical protein
MIRMAAIETAARRRQDDDDTETLALMGVRIYPGYGGYWAQYRAVRMVTGPFRTRRDAIDAAYDRLTEQECN